MATASTPSGSPAMRKSQYEPGLLDQEWRDFCALLQADQPYAERFANISKRMDSIDLSLLPHHLKCPVVECYRRTVIGALHSPDEAGFEAVLAHWRLDCVTPIHGHPPVVMYRALSGLYRMTLYEKVNGVLQPSEVRMISAGDWFYHEGVGEGYDHFIHTIECIDEGWTLNLYSDDATKGVKYEP